MRMDDCNPFCRCRCSRGFVGARLCARLSSVDRENITINEVYNILNNSDNSVLIDVRSKQEYAEGNLRGSINIPLYDLERYAENIIPYRDITIIVYCQSGIRSLEAARFLRQKGYRIVYNLEGGIDGI